MAYLDACLCVEVEGMESLILIRIMVGEKKKRKAPLGYSHLDLVASKFNNLSTIYVFFFFFRFHPTLSKYQISVTVSVRLVTDLRR